MSNGDEELEVEEGFEIESNDKQDSINVVELRSSEDETDVF